MTVTAAAERAMPQHGPRRVARKADRVEYSETGISWAGRLPAHAEIRCGPHHGVAGNRLGVEEQPIHIEEDRSRGVGEADR